MDQRRTRAGLDDSAEIPEADRLEQQPALDELPERSPEADEADQLEQATPLPGQDDDYPHQTQN